MLLVLLQVYDKLIPKNLGEIVDPTRIDRSVTILAALIY